MNTHSPESVEIAETVIYQRLQDEAVLLEMNTQEYFGLDDVGVQMWELLVEHHKVDTVVACLQTIYGVDEAKLRRDLHSLIEQLMVAGLLTPSRAG